MVGFGADRRDHESQLRSHIQVNEVQIQPGQAEVRNYPEGDEYERDECAKRDKHVE